jgi:hypothetical protein
MAGVEGRPRIQRPNPTRARARPPRRPTRAADLSSTCRLGEHLMASHVFQWTWRTLYTCPKPPEPTFSQPANSSASKVRSSPRAHGPRSSPSIARVSPPPGAAAAAQVPRCAPRPVTSLPTYAPPRRLVGPAPSARLGTGSDECGRTDGRVGSLRCPRVH